jgi:hypothetical protein
VPARHESGNREWTRLCPREAKANRAL